MPPFALGLALLASTSPSLAGRPCTDVSIVHGYQRCPADVPLIQLSLGMSYRSIDLATMSGAVHLSNRGKGELDPTVSIPTGGLDGLSAHLVTINQSIGFTLRNWLGFAFGLDIGLGNLSGSPINSAWTYTKTGTPQATYINGGAQLFAPLSIGSLIIRPSFFAGYQGLILSSPTIQVGDKTSAILDGFLLEPRLALGLWTSPYVTLQAGGGVDIRHPSNTMLSIDFTVYTSPWNGSRDP
jgi:hypothetical protein